MVILCPIVDGILSVLKWHWWILSWGWAFYSKNWSTNSNQDIVVWGIILAILLFILLVMRVEDVKIARNYPALLVLILIFWPFTWHIVLSIILAYIAFLAIKEVLKGANS